MTSQNEEPLIETAKLIAKIETNLGETVKMKKVHKPNFVGKSYNIVECNQSHLLYCSTLIVSNKLISYIPEYQDILYDDDQKEQFYITSLMMKNIQKKQQIEEDI